MAEAEEAPKPTIEIERTEIIADFVAAVADGNRMTSPPLPTAAHTTEMLNKLIAEAKKPEWQAQYEEIGKIADERRF